MKTCIKCKILKPFNDFVKDKRKSDGIRKYCLKCNSLTHKKWREKNKNRINKYQEKFNKSNPEYKIKYHADWYAFNREEKIVQNKNWKFNNKIKYQKQQTEYVRRKRKEDINFKLASCLRRRINSALKTNQKTGSAVKDLGCSIAEFKYYIESRFQNGMTWENYGLGKGKWNLDHIYPLSRVDLTDIEQFRKACHFTNIQPMWSSDNLKKGNKI